MISRRTPSPGQPPGNGETDAEFAAGRQLMSATWPVHFGKSFIFVITKLTWKTDYQCFQILGIDFL
ncbi:hypothetical protein ACPA9J_24910 [Pseudomonas aeruginosa]